LKSAGITAVLNLQTQDDFDYHSVCWSDVRAIYFAKHMDVRRVPIRDFDDNDLREKLPAAVSVLAELMDSGHTCYVHCNVGVNRSPSTVICFLHWMLGWTIDDAEMHVRRCRDCSPVMEVIRTASRDHRRG
jgi:protein-tyrosine phosphatase